MAVQQCFRDMLHSIAVLSALHAPSLVRSEWTGAQVCLMWCVLGCALHTPSAE